MYIDYAVIMKIIGICGGSCSGKSTLVNVLTSKLKELTIIHFDDFFVGKDAIEDQDIQNWEDPTLFRFTDYENTLRTLKGGKEIQIQANSRESRHQGLTTRILKPNKYIIVEGFLIYYTENARKYFDTKIFLDIPEDEMIRRRYIRMENGGGKYSDKYLRETLVNEYRKNVIPQKQYADLIIDGTKSPENILREILSSEDF